MAGELILLSGVACRAAGIVLGSLLDRGALPALCDSDEPLLAGAASAVASQLWETRNDLDSARRAAPHTSRNGRPRRASATSPAA